MKIKSILVSIILVLIAGQLISVPAVLSFVEINGRVGASYQLLSENNTTDGDIYLNNFDVSVEINPGDFFSTYLGLIYDDSLESFEVDEAYAKVRLIEEYSFNLGAGKFYQPTSMGTDYTNFITDPQTYTFTEISNLGLMADVSWSSLTLTATLFKEEIQEDDTDSDDSNLDAFVINLASEHELTEGSLILSTSYISNLLNSSIFSDEEEADESGLKEVEESDKISAISFGSAISWNNFSLLGEFALTLDDYNDEKPSVLHTELGYSLFENLGFALQYGMTKNADFLPETTMGAIMNYTFLQNSFSSLNIGLEYILTKDYDDEKTETTTLKLTYDF